MQWVEISGAPVGEMRPNERYETLVRVGDDTINAVYRAHWLWGWTWFDKKGRRIKPDKFLLG